MYLKRKRTTSLLMVALFSTSLLHANITYEANAAVVQQQSVCKGTVVDNNGDPVVGASVFVVSNGQKKGSVTDLDGNFEIAGVASGSSLTISYVGYKTQQVTWTGKDLKVTLQENSEMLENVVGSLPNLLYIVSNISLFGEERFHRIFVFDYVIAVCFYLLK